MRVKFYNAKNGDAIHLLTDNNKNIVIDMGYPETYSDYIKTHINDIHCSGANIDLLVITHTDQDHLGGALRFLQDVGNGIFDKDMVNEIWYNSYRHLQLSQVESITAEDHSVLKALEEAFESENKKEHAAIGDEKISAQQGSILAGLIYKEGLSWNGSFGNGPITGSKKVQLGNLDITVLTPNPTALNSLKKFWRSELLTQKWDFQFGEDELFDDAYEFYLLNEAIIEDEQMTLISGDSARSFHALLECGIDMKASGDRSITNAASISLIIEENGKRILLTADATDNDLFDALNELLNTGISLDFDLIKLSHHGALKNNMRWLSLVTAKYFIISTDASKHNHPELGSIANAIITSKETQKIICFNNHLSIVEEINDIALMEKYNYSILIPNKDWGLEIEL